MLAHARNKKVTFVCVTNVNEQYFSTQARDLIFIIYTELITMKPSNQTDNWIHKVFKLQCYVFGPLYFHKNVILQYTSSEILGARHESRSSSWTEAPLNSGQLWGPVLNLNFGPGNIINLIWLGRPAALKVTLRSIYSKLNASAWFVHRFDDFVIQTGMINQNYAPFSFRSEIKTENGRSLQYP